MDCNMNNYNMRSNMNYSTNNYGMNAGIRNNRSMNNDMHMRSYSRTNMDMRNASNCEDDSNSGCDIVKDHIDHMCPGMAYVPWQKWECVYDMEKGFERGTIFEQLDKPYIGRCKK